MMQSCWLIEFRDGHKVILSEAMYEVESKDNFNDRPVLCESHWFDYEVCRDKNKGVRVVGLGEPEKDYEILLDFIDGNSIVVKVPATSLQEALRKAAPTSFKLWGTRGHTN